MRTQKHGAQFTAYRLADAERVLSVLRRHAGPERAATEQRLAAEGGMLPERKFRACLADFDGVRWLIAKNAAGLFLAELASEADSLSAEIRSKVETMEQRLGRRDALARALAGPGTQLGLGMTA